MGASGHSGESVRKLTNLCPRLGSKRVRWPTVYRGKCEDITEHESQSIQAPAPDACVFVAGGTGGGGRALCLARSPAKPSSKPSSGRSTELDLLSRSPGTRRALIAYGSAYTIKGDPGGVNGANEPNGYVCGSVARKRPTQSAAVTPSIVTGRRSAASVAAFAAVGAGVWETGLSAQELPAAYGSAQTAGSRDPAPRTRHSLHSIMQT